MSDRRIRIAPLESLLEHRTWVRAVARSLVRDEHAAEDLAQEAWVRAMRSPPDPARDPKPWLRRVLKNLASNRRRGDARRTKRETAWRDRRAQRSPGELVAEAEQHKRLVGLVLDLEEPFKTVLVLRFYEGLAPKEIAARLEIPVGTVHSRLARATDRLKARLDAQEQGNRTTWVAALLPLAAFDRAAPVAVASAAASSLTGILLMALSKPKVALLTVLLLSCLVGGGVYLASLSIGEDGGARRSELLTADGESDAPTLEGRGTLRGEATASTERPQPKARIAESVAATAWRGRILDHEGKPAPGVQVFALSRGVRGVEKRVLDDERFGRQVTGTDGRFEVRIGDVAAPRLVAWSEGAMPASVDLTARDPEQPLELRLGKPRIVTVRIEHQLVGGRAEMGVNVRTSHEGFERTDDSALQSLFYWRDEPEFADGDAFVVPLNTTAPVSVDLDYPRGQASIPRRHAVAPGDQTVTFRIVPSGQIRYRLIDASTGKPLAPGVRTTLFLFEPGTRSVVASSSTADPSFEVTTALPPGTYHYEFKANGYAMVVGDLVVHEPGQRLEGVLRLEPQREKGAPVLLRVHRGPAAPPELLAMARTGAKESWGFSVAVLIRRDGERPWRATHVAGSPSGQVRVWPGGLSAAPARFEDGLYDIYVAHRETGTAALLRKVRLFRDEDNEFDVRLVPGTLFRLTALVGKDRPLKSCDVRMPEVGTLPWVEFKRWGWRTFASPQEMTKALAVPRREKVLGPFPAAEIEVVATDQKGVTSTYRVRGPGVLVGRPAVGK